MTLSELKVLIKARLTRLSGITVYDGKAAENATFPYLCYTFTSTSFQYRNRDDRILEIDYWNNSNDDSGILAAAEKVKNGTTVLGVEIPGLNFSYQDETSGFYHAYIDFEGEIPTQERNLSRYNQRFILKSR